MDKYIERRIKYAIEFIRGEDDLSELTFQFYEQCQEVILEVVYEVIDNLRITIEEKIHNDLTIK